MTKIPSKNLNKFLPLIFLTLGVALFSSFSPSLAQEDVAPYPYQEHEDYDFESLYKQQERFLLKRIHRSPSGGGLDLAALSNVYASMSNLNGDLSLMDKAETAAKKSLTNLPYYNTSAKLVLAKVAEARHRFPEAIEQAKKVLEEKPGDEGALSILVSTSLGYGKLVEALNYANELVGESPGVNSYAMRGLVFLAQGSEEVGLKDFSKALTLEDPGDRQQSAWLRTMIGRHHYRKGDMQSAEQYTDSALSVLSNYHVALAQKADIRAIQGDMIASQRYYSKAFKEREEPPYLLAMANIKEDLNLSADAERLRKKAENSVRSEIETTPYGHYNELAQLLIDRNQINQRKEAVEAARKDVAQRMTSESYYLLAQALYNSEEFPEAQNAILTAIKSGEINCEYNVLEKKISAQINNLPFSENEMGCPQAAQKQKW